MTETELTEHTVQLAGEIELLLIRIGKRRFALSLSEVKHIVPLPFDFAFAGTGVSEYYAFEGEPLKFISGWDVAGETTAYQEFSELQPMLPLRRQDHIDWMAALEHSIHDGAAFTKARDPHECAFGKWYYSYRPKDKRLAVLLSNFEQPHASIHGLADRLLGMVESGKREEAIHKLEEAKSTTMVHLMDVFDRADILLGTLQRRIAIILERGDTHCALGADMVLDIVTLPNKNLTWDTHEGEMVPRLAMMADESIVPFFRWGEVLASRGRLKLEDILPEETEATASKETATS